MTDNKRTNGLTILAFAIMIVLGGSNAVAVRFSNQELPPFWGAAFRFSTAAVILWAVVLVRRKQIPRGRALLGMVIYGTLTVGVSYAFLYWALVYVTATVTMVVGTLVPLITFFLAWAHGQEKFRWRGLIGALISFGGILFSVGGEIGSSIPLLPLLALLAGGFALAEGSVLIKSYPKSDPVIVNAIALTTGAVILFLLSLIAGEVQSLPGSSTTWIAYTYLVVGGTVMLFYLYLYVLQRWTASATSYSFLLFPVWTILLASWLTDEVLSPRFLLGGVFLLFGVWLGAFSRPRKPKNIEPAVIQG